MKQKSFNIWQIASVTTLACNCDPDGSHQGITSSVWSRSVPAYLERIPTNAPASVCGENASAQPALC